MKLKGHTIGFRGEYSATVLKADGTVKEFLNEEKTLKSGQVIKNRLLDNFFQKLISTTIPIGNTSIRCGTGASVVNDSESSLNNQLTLLSGNWPISGPSTANSYIDGDFIKAESTYTFTFSLGAISGNVSELGINFDGTGTASVALIHSRALVVDGLGDPTTISVSVEEQLIINYTLKMQSSVDDTVSTVTALINGVPTDLEVTARWSGFVPLMSYINSTFRSTTNTSVLAYDGALGAIGVSSAGSSTNLGPSSFTYNQSGGKEATSVSTTSQGNFAGGITVISPGGSIGQSSVKFGFNPPLPKDADRTLSATFRQTFGRIP